MDTEIVFYRELYPVLIFQTRYGGVYEGGCWACIANAKEIPKASIEDDISCCEWWLSMASSLVGVGYTSDGAYLDMIHRYKTAGLLKDE